MQDTGRGRPLAAQGSRAPRVHDIVLSRSASPGTPDRAGEGARNFLFRNWSADWVRVGAQSGFPVKHFAAAEKSQIFAEGRRRTAPFTWQDVERERGLNAVEAEVRDVLAECGWHDGLLVPVHGPAGYFAMVAMASPERDLDLGPGRRAHLRMAAMLAHERASRSAASTATRRSSR